MVKTPGRLLIGYGREGAEHRFHGGPIFNDKHEQVGVLVRGTGSNLVMNEAANCYNWGSEPEEKGFAEGNLIFPIVNFLNDQK